MSDFPKFTGDLLEKDVVTFVQVSIAEILTPLLGVEGFCQVLAIYAKDHPESLLNTRIFPEAGMTSPRILEIRTAFRGLTDICCAFRSVRRHGSHDNFKNLIDPEKVELFLSFSPYEFLTRVVAEFRQLTGEIENLAQTIHDNPYDNPIVVLDLTLSELARLLLEYVIELKKWYNLLEAYAEKLKKEAG